MRRTASEIINDLEVRIARLEGRTNNRTASMFSELGRVLSDCIEDIYNGRMSLIDLRRNPRLVSLETAESWALDNSYNGYDMRSVQNAIDALHAKGLVDTEEGIHSRNVRGYSFEDEEQESFLTPSAVKYFV